jgi:hypothetical protein
MTNETEESELHRLLAGLKIDAEAYFKKAEKLLDGVEISESSFGWILSDQPRNWDERDQYWSKLPDGLKDEARRVDNRLVSLMRQVARASQNAPLSSEADQRDVQTGTKAMRAALLLRRFRSWSTEVLNDEDVVLGVKPAGQSDDEPFPPLEAGRTFSEWAEKIESIIDLAATSPDLGPIAGHQPVETVRYRPGTAFIMMWMDQSKPELNDVSDAVKEVFGRFGIHANRADDIEHEGLITERILSEIKTAEFCFADLSGGRPNVYYEVGFAHALPRRVILFRKTGTGLHFDLAGYNCPEYVNLGDLKEKLTNRLRALTNKEPKQ